MESYLLQSNLALAIFYLLFRIIGRAENNQQIRRFMGLLILIFCCVIPILPTFNFTESSTIPMVFDDAIQRVATLKSGLANASSIHLNPWLFIYFLGVGIFFTRSLIGFGKIMMLILKNRTERKWGFTLVESKKESSPFSFFGYLFIHRRDIDKPGIEPIILHEQFHKDQLHSIDIILLELLTVIFWFNPFIWLFQKEIKDTHEYMADEHVINKGVDKLDYQDLLFEARTGISFKSVNYLSNQTSLKQRFNMMEKRKTHSKLSSLRAGSVLVAMALAVFITSFSNVNEVFDDDKPNIQIFTKDGLVDLNKGISKTTNKLFVRMVPKEDDKMRAYRVSKLKITLVVEGLGRESQMTGESIDLSLILPFIQETEKECTLLVEIEEYQTMDKQKRVEKVVPEELILFKIPIK